MSTRRAFPTRTVAALAALLLLLLLCEAAGWRFLRTPVARALSGGLERPVAMDGSFRLHLLGSLRVAADYVAIAPAEAGRGRAHPPASAQPLVQADALRLELGYGELLRHLAFAKEGPLVIRSLSAGHLQVDLARDADGRANWDPPPTATAAQPGASPWPEFGELVVRSGRVALDDGLTHTRFTASIATNEGTESGTPATAATPPRATGLTVDVTGRYRNAPFTAALHAGGLLPLVAGGKLAQPAAFTIDVHSAAVRLHLEGSASDLMRLSGLDARFRIAGPSLAAIGDPLSVTLPTTAAFTAEGRLRKNGAVWTTALDRLAIGSSRLRGEFAYDQGQATPRLTGTLRGSTLALADLGPAVGAASARPARPAGSGDARVLPQRAFDLPSLGAMDADVQIDIDRLDLGSASLAPLEPARARVLLHESVLTLQDLDVRTADGRLDGVMALDARRRDMPKLSVHLSLADIRLERFVKARAPTHAADVPESNRGYVSGRLAGRLELAGRGRSVAELLASLQGQGDLWVTGGTVSHLLVEATGIDVAQALGVLVRGDDKLPMACAVTRWAVQDGTARPQVAVVDTGDSTILVTGAVSLAREQLDLRLETRPKDISPFALRSPVHVEGSFAQPTIRLEARPIGARLAAAAALAAVTPLAGLLALIDLGEPDRAACAQALGPARNGRPAAAARPTVPADACKNCGRNGRAAPAQEASRGAADGGAAN